MEPAVLTWEMAWVYEKNTQFRVRNAQILIPAPSHTRHLSRQVSWHLCISISSTVKWAKSWPYRIVERIQWDNGGRFQGRHEWDLVSFHLPVGLNVPLYASGYLKRSHTREPQAQAPTRIRRQWFQRKTVTNGGSSARPDESSLARPPSCSCRWGQLLEETPGSGPGSCSGTDSALLPALSGRGAHS